MCITKSDNLELNVILLDELEVPNITSSFKVVIPFKIVSLLTVIELVVKSVSKNVLVSEIVNNPDVLVNCVPFFITKSDNLELKLIILLKLEPQVILFSKNVS